MPPPVGVGARPVGVGRDRVGAARRGVVPTRSAPAERMPTTGSDVAAALRGVVPTRPALRDDCPQQVHLCGAFTHNAGRRCKPHGGALARNGGRKAASAA
ncbi:hypothetical protein GCM10014713_18790 [Streptomyces purpureus]|uniref:Uncharacterized protein n=1 Tax=Streptomyces purpureus TaxID=1951 RepID=A0A918H0F7_9ACTN|nr:hypothetical protein GCM10014713_18790 [Streptomyces purpureus]